jgi:hypothetical protein
MVTSMLVRLLETMFGVGLAGSAVVFVLTTIEDVITMASKDAPVQVDPPRSEA